MLADGIGRGLEIDDAEVLSFGVRIQNGLETDPPNRKTPPPSNYTTFLHYSAFASFQVERSIM
jgi:hypothetical protein